MSRYYQLIRRDGTVYTSSQREKVEDRIRADWPDASPDRWSVRRHMRLHCADVTD